MTDKEERKLSTFQRNSDGKFVCLICDTTLSSKQRTLHHLNLVHDFSPVKPVNKLYNVDSSKPIPKRTLMRKRKLIHEETNKEIGPSPAKLDKDETSVDLFPKENSGNACDENLADLSVQVQEIFDKASKCSMSDIDSDSVCSSSSSEVENDSLNDSASADTDSEISDHEHLSTEDRNIQGNEQFSFGLAAYILRYNCSKASSESLISLVKAFNSNSDVTKDLTYNKIFLEVGHSKYKVIHYCQICLNRFPDDVDIFNCSTELCNGLRYIGDVTKQIDPKRKPNAFFIICDVAWQLKLLLERDGILQEILRNKAKAKDVSTSMSDIYQGTAYQSMCKDGNFLSSLYNLSGILNTDGIPLYSSSKVKLWPVYVSVNELSIFNRFSRGNTLLAGIWQGTGNPPFLQYLLSIAEELTSVYETGVQVVTNDGMKVVKLCVCLATMDLQAKAYATSMTMHNGAFWCITCEEQGETVKQGKGYSRCYPYRPPHQRPHIRDSDDIKLVKSPAATSGKRIKGIVGPSAFIAMPWFDMVNGMTPDYMHSVLMGVCKHLLYLWVSPTQSGKPYFVGKSLKLISKRLKKITPPSFIQRLPRDLENHYGHLKATELQTWLLFYAYPCLQGILEDKYLRHFCLLSEGIHILLGDSITPGELDRAEKLLDDFYKTFTDLYSPGSCGLNVHNIGAHLVFYVRQWGPLFCWSCFGFEDNNAEVLKSVHGTGDVTRQIINYKLTDLYIRTKSTEMIADANSVWLDFLSRVCPNNTGQLMSGDEKPSGTEYSKENFASKEEQCYVLAKIGLNNVKDYRITHRILRQGKFLYSKKYKRMKRRNCYTVLCMDGVILAISYFIENIVNEKLFAVGHICSITEPVHPFCDVGYHLLRMKTEEDVHVVLVDTIIEEVFVIQTENTFFYVSRVPNLYGRSVFK